MADGSSPPVPNELQQTLLQFAETPGKYSVRLRQPATLFAGVTEVLQLASMRNPPDDRHAAELVEAARFFIRTALLHPEADHHAVLGLEDGAAAQVAKERYRLLMRLLHPDFAGAQADWPADAAARVNRAYDYVSSGGAAPEPAAAPTSVVPSARPPRPAPARAIAADPAWIIPKSRLKQVFIMLGIIGVCLMLLVLGIDRQGPVHLVQKPPPAAPQRVVEIASKPEASDSSSSVGSALSDLLADFSGSSSLQLSKELHPNPAPQPAADATRNKPAAPAVVAQKPPAPAVARNAPVPDDPAPQAPSAAGPAQVTPRQAPDLSALAPPAPVVAAAPVPVPEPVRNVVVTPSKPEPPAVQPVQVAAAPQAVSTPAPRPGLTLLEAQPLLAVLLQHMEAGRGERVISLLEPDARSRPAAQAFSRQYDSLVEGGRVRLSQVQFRAEPGEGKLVVFGQMRLQFPDLPVGATPRRFNVQAEFVVRNGTVVLSGLSGGPVN